MLWSLSTTTQQLNKQENAEHGVNNSKPPDNTGLDQNMSVVKL
jgi:hypothetical protein